MKPLAFALVFFVFFRAGAQSLFTVNNTPGIKANYTTLQGALDSVPDGSVLFLQPSALTYGSATIRKPVVIYGPGYFLGQNPNPNNQAKNSVSVVGHLDFAKGSNGSKVYGLSFIEPSAGYGHRIATDSTSDITVARCKFDIAGCCCQGCRNFMFIINNSGSVTIEQCYIGIEATLLYPNKSTGILFRNNLIVSAPWINWGLLDWNTLPYDFIMENNTLYGDFQTLNFGGGTLTNNVIIKSSNGTYYPGSGPNMATNNVSNVNLFGNRGNNISNADGANTFLGTSDPGVSSLDGVWQLKAGSVAIGHGTDGKDAGAYGGSRPYVLSGIPPIPNIYFADVTQPGTSNGGLKVHLRVKANQ